MAASFTRGAGLANHDSVHALTLSGELPFVLSAGEIETGFPWPSGDSSQDVQRQALAALETYSRAGSGAESPDFQAVVALCRMLLSVGEARRNLDALQDSEAALIALIEKLTRGGGQAGAGYSWGDALPLRLGLAGEEPAAERMAPAEEASIAAPGLRARLFGRFEVEVDGRPLPAWRSRRARQLLQYLLLNHGESVSRHRLMGVFWPDHSEDRAENNLSLTVMTLRRVLDQTAAGAGLRVAFVDGSYRVDPNQLWLDVDAFDAAIEQARGLDKAGDATSAAEAFDTAIALYGGDLLPGEMYEEWTTARRQRLQDRFVEALQRRAALARIAGDVELSIRLHLRALEVDPALEAAHRQLIVDYLETGQRSRAAHQVEACREALRKHLGEEPDSESLAVFARVHSPKIN